MKYSLQTNHISLSELDQQQIEEKIQRLDKHVNHPYTLEVRLSHDTHHSHGEVVTCQLNVGRGKQSFYAERTGATVQDALDEALAALKRELTKQHDKNKRHRE